MHDRLEPVGEVSACYEPGDLPGAWWNISSLINRMIPGDGYVYPSLNTKLPEQPQHLNLD